MEKTKSLTGGSKMHMKNPYKIFVFVIVGLLAIGLGYATSISNSQITSENMTLTGSLFQMSSNDAVLKMNGYNSILGAGAGGLYINQTRPEAKGGLYWSAWDEASSRNRLVGWFVCHYNSSINGDSHQHCSIETLDNQTGTPSINSHFTMTYASNQTNSTIAFPNSNVYFGTNQPVYFGSDLTRYIVRDGANGNLVLNSNTSAVRFTGNLITSSGKSFIVASGDVVQLFPNNQQTVGLQINNTASGLEMKALGSSNLIESGDNVTITALAGSGNAFACLDENGMLYRSATACA